VTGAGADAARVRRRLRRLGVRRRHWTPSAGRPITGWESLTETERAASELVAQGLNTRQIANRMYVSVNTVAFYMRQIFRKLNIGSRVELAASSSSNPADPAPLIPAKTQAGVNADKPRAERPFRRRSARPCRPAHSRAEWRLLAPGVD